MSWVIRRDPLNELRGMQEDVNRVFQSAFPRIFGAEDGLQRGTWNPTVDIFENEERFVLEADLPGLQPGDFDLSIENYTLTLRGERKFEKRTEGDNYHRVERAYGAFTRTFTLPSTIDVEGVQAEFKDGVLRVTMPKREEVKPRQVQISIRTEADAGKVRTAEAK